MWQYGKQIDHYTADQMKTYACQYADQCNADGECTTGCDERKKNPLTNQDMNWRDKMNEIEVAAGAAIAAQSAAHVAYKRCQDDVQYSVDGSRHLTCANANLSKLHEAVSLIEKAARLMLDARDRQARMLDE